MSKTNPVIYAIGDIHGRLDLLDELLDKIEKHRAGKPHKLVFLGDYVDRGTQSRQVLDRLIELKAKGGEYPPEFLLGNHEDSINKVLTLDLPVGEFEKWVYWGGYATLKSYGIDINPDDVDRLSNDENENLCVRFKKAIMPEHREFLGGLKRSFETATHFFCHAGVDFDVPLDEQNPSTLIWIRTGFLDSDKRADKIIVHGHSITPDLKPQVKHNRIAVDTGAYKSGSLTACVIQGSNEPQFIMT